MVDEAMRRPDRATANVCSIDLLDSYVREQEVQEPVTIGGVTDSAVNIVKRTTLIVRDMAASRRFYEYVLGMSVWLETEFVLSGAGLAAGKAGDRTHLVIMRAQDPKVGMIGLLQWLEPPWPAPPPPAEVTYGMPIFVVETGDAEGLANRADEIGARVYSRPRCWSTRGARGETRRLLGVSVFDPDGHFFECNQVLGIDEPLTEEQPEE